MEDDLQWKMTFNGRPPSMEEDLQWKMTFKGRRPSMEGRLFGPKKISDPKSFGPKSFNYLGPNINLDAKFFIQNALLRPIFLDPKSFDPKLFWADFFWIQISFNAQFFNPSFLLDTNFLGPPLHPLSFKHLISSVVTLAKLVFPCETLPAKLIPAYTCSIF